ncbi:hypothetical protein SNE40_000781 [Patella caerulea]|uniref:PIPK domain-containing protein n=1 Tax=Patella caerulea TaxID=87958 RepID=A0AAN8KB67_PATCE
MEMTEMDKTSQTSRASTVKQRSSAWKRLRKRMSRKGVVEVDIDHHRYQMLECIRKGIRDTLLEHSDLGPKEDLKEEDYRHIVAQKITTEDGKEFMFESYASSVFAAVRQAINLSEENYLNSVAPPMLPYLEFVSNSKSGQDFYLTNDMQYIFKTDKKYWIDYFISILGDYLNHFLTYPHSLIVKFLGLYSINLPGNQKKYFLVMQSIFYPSHRIEDRFDIKGCLAGRYQKPRPPGSTIVTVYKDQNFVDESLNLGTQGEWFIEQLKADTLFMKELGVQDYSLLVGRQIRHVDEQKETLSNLISRMQK